MVGGGGGAAGQSRKVKVGKSTPRPAGELHLSHAQMERGGIL